MRKNITKLVRNRREDNPANQPVGSALERWKAIASIASAVAIPFVLAVVGYFIQKQLADEGIKKDYVSIAAGILKESATAQESDLRKWGGRGTR